MNTELIIETAAKKAGKTLPIDDYDREFGEAMIRSLDHAMELLHGQRKPSGDDFWGWITGLTDESEAFTNE